MVNKAKAELGGTTTKEESFSTTFNLQSFTKRVNKLSKNQKKSIEETGFGPLLMIPGHRLSKNLLAELMERWCPDSHAFLIVPSGMSNGSSNNAIPLKITLTDVALVLGLRVTGDPVILREHEPFSDLEAEYGATPGNRKLTVASIEKKLDSFGNAVSDDFVRLFLLFTFAKLLFPSADSKIDSRYLSLLQDLDRVHTFAWGEAVLKNITYWLSKRKDKSEQSVGGCLIFLQVLTKIQLSPHEEKIDIFSAVHKDMVDENRARLNIMDQWIADMAQEPESIVSTSKEGPLTVVIVSDDDEEENISNRDRTLLLEENTELKKEINSLREDYKTIKDQLKEENAESKSLREEIKVLKDKLQEQNAKLDALRKENQLASSSSEGRKGLTEIQIITREYEQQYGIQL